jgi:hypothetical protein
MIVPIEEVLRVIGSIIGRDIVARLDRRASDCASAAERGIEYLADTKNTHDCEMGIHGSGISFFLGRIRRDQNFTTTAEFVRHQLAAPA